MEMGISSRRLRSMLKRLKPVPWSIYLKRKPRRRGALFTMPNVENIEFIRLAQQIIAAHFPQTNKSLSQVRCQFFQGLPDAETRNALGDIFDTTRDFYSSLCYGADSYVSGRDPDIEEFFPCWEIGVSGDSPLAALNKKRFRKSDPIWNDIFPPITFGDTAYISNSEGRKSKQPSGLPERVCNPIDFLNAKTGPWWWPF